MGNTAVLVFVASSLANVLKKGEISSLDVLVFGVGIYRFCDRRFRH